jgi:PEGA domain
MRLGCGLVIALLLVPASASAGVPVLVEHHAMRPSARSARLLATLATGLGSRVRQGSAVVTAARGLLGQRARPLSAARLSQLVSAVKAGAEHGYAGDWTRAVTTLQSARQGLMGDVLSLARQRTLLRALQRARLLLVMCYLRLKQPRRAWAMMEEGLRTQPDLSPSGALYGPDLQRLYYRVKAQMDLQKARLRVTTDPPGALIFLNGRSIGFSPVTAAGLYPGTYDVLVVKGKQHSRIRRFRVASSQAHLRVDLGLDGAVRLGAQLGLRVSGGVQGRAHALRYARTLGIHLGARRVLLVGVRKRSSGRVLHGRLVDCTRGVVLRAAFVSVTQVDPGAEALGGLGRYLLEGGVPGAGVHRATISLPVRRARQGRPVTDPSGVEPWRRPGSMTGFGVAGWILLGSGLITAGTGGVLWGIDGHTRLGAAREADRYDTDRAGTVVLGVGLGVAALGAVLLIVDAVARRRSRPAPRRTRLQPVLAPTRDGWSLGLAGRF